MQSLQGWNVAKKEAKKGESSNFMTNWGFEKEAEMTGEGGAESGLVGVGGRVGVVEKPYAAATGFAGTCDGQTAVNERQFINFNRRMFSKSKK